MPLAAKQKDDYIKVKQYITDAKGHKVAAILRGVQRDTSRIFLATIQKELDAGSSA
jgi:hypothetical protein